jgi:hypothetical protein
MPSAFEPLSGQMEGSGQWSPLAQRDGWTVRLMGAADVRHRVEDPAQDGVGESPWGMNELVTWLRRQLHPLPHPNIRSATSASYAIHIT